MNTNPKGKPGAIGTAEDTYDAADLRRATWEGRKWEWFPPQLLSAEPGDSGGPAFLGLELSDRYFLRSYDVSAAIGKPPVGAGSVYWLGIRDRTGAFLDGGKTYKLTVPGPVPGRLFWSVTVYDAETRCLIATDQHRSAIRSLLDRPQANPDGSFDLFFGPEAPPGKEGMWVKTIPGKAWWSGFSIYGPLAPAFDGTWKLNDIERES